TILRMYCTDCYIRWSLHLAFSLLGDVLRRCISLPTVLCMYCTDLSSLSTSQLVVSSAYRFSLLSNFVASSTSREHNDYSNLDISFLLLFILLHSLVLYLLLQEPSNSPIPCYQ
ncbi:hypothetical protein PFISCL1PPCAC_23004, partial [Pristionchus fissidentatus]